MTDAHKTFCSELLSGVKSLRLAAIKKSSHCSSRADVSRRRQMLNMAPEVIGNPRIIPKMHCINKSSEVKKKEKKLRLEKQRAECDVRVSRQRDECQLFSSAKQFDTSVFLIETAGRHCKKKKRKPN